MPNADFCWRDAFVIPAALCLRPTPSGGLQVGSDTVQLRELSAESISLLLLFSRARTAETAFSVAAEGWELERSDFQRLIEGWVAGGLLQTARSSSSSSSRLALFALAQAGVAPNATPLRSNFTLQRPAEFFPGLDTREIHDPNRFPWVAALESSFAAIQDELTSLLRTGGGMSLVYPEYTSVGEWAAAYLWSFGKKNEEICRACPQTTSLLAAVPGVADFGTALFSALAPRSHIAPHFGYTNAKLRCQLPIRVRGDCKLKVGDCEVSQREGKCIVFDDSFLHSAWNESDEARFVLVFDFFHPDLLAAEIRLLLRLAGERQLSAGVLAATADGERVPWARPA